MHLTKSFLRSIMDAEAIIYIQQDINNRHLAWLLAYTIMRQLPSKIYT